MNFYAVKAMFGHVGRNKTIIKEVPVSAESGKEAAYKVRNMPRVKHHRKDAIIEVNNINLEEFNLLQNIVSIDPYFKCSSKQEQKRLCGCLEDIIIDLSKPKVDIKSSRVKRHEKYKYLEKKRKQIIDDALFQDEYEKELIIV